MQGRGNSMQCIIQQVVLAAILAKQPSELWVVAFGVRLGIQSHDQRASPHRLREMETEPERWPSVVLLFFRMKR